MEVDSDERDCRLVLLLRLRDSGIWNDRLQQKLDDTELIFLIIKWYMWYMPVLFPAR